MCIDDKIQSSALALSVVSFNICICWAILRGLSNALRYFRVDAVHAQRSVSKNW